MSADSYDAHGLRHPAGFATYPGDVSGILGEVKGPTTFGSVVIAAGAEYDPDTDSTHVAFVYANEDDMRQLQMAAQW